MRRRADGKGRITPVEQLIDILPHPVCLLLSSFENESTPVMELRALEVSPASIIQAVRLCEQVGERLLVAEPPARELGKTLGLVAWLRPVRPDLRFMWLRFPVIRFLGWTLKRVLKMLKPGKARLDLYATFASKRYQTFLAATVIASARADIGGSVEAGPRVAQKSAQTSAEVG